MPSTRKNGNSKRVPWRSARGSFHIPIFELGFATLHAIAMVEWIAVEWLEVERNAERVAHCRSIVNATDVSRTSSVEDRVRVH